jgi:hypothetical protein
MKRSLFFLALAGCAYGTVLEPAPSATRVPGDDDAAQARAHDVVVVVDPGRPDIFTPFRVHIENRSGRRLRLRYDAFTLSTPSGFAYTAISPYQIEYPYDPPLRAGFVSYRYALAMHHHPLYPFDRFDLWYGPYDPWYTGWPYRYLSREELQEALPEGVLENGGYVNGLVYFPEVDEGAVFTFTLVDADTGRSFGSIRIPFIGRRG